MTDKPLLGTGPPTARYGFGLCRQIMSFRCMQIELPRLYLVQIMMLIQMNFCSLLNTPALYSDGRASVHEKIDKCPRGVNKHTGPNLVGSLGTAASGYHVCCKLV